MTIASDNYIGIKTPSALKKNVEFNYFNILLRINY